MKLEHKTSMAAAVLGSGHKVFENFQKFNPTNRLTDKGDLFADYKNLD